MDFISLSLQKTYKDLSIQLLHFPAILFFFFLVTFCCFCFVLTATAVLSILSKLLFSFSLFQCELICICCCLLVMRIFYIRSIATQLEIQFSSGYIYGDLSFIKAFQCYIEDCGARQESREETGCTPLYLKQKTVEK